jgi:hypothetical protein
LRELLQIAAIIVGFMSIRPWPSGQSTCRAIPFASFFVSFHMADTTHNAGETA